MKLLLCKAEFVVHVLCDFLYIQNEYGETALFGACRGGHAETARVLLDHGINMDCQNKVSLSLASYPGPR